VKADRVIAGATTVTPAGVTASIAAPSPWRRRGIDALTVITMLLTIVATFAVWANRQLLVTGVALNLAHRMGRGRRDGER
jgi:hypothetical protein